MGLPRPGLARSSAPGSRCAWDVPRRALGLVAGFGAGTLVAAPRSSCACPPYREAGRAVTAIALGAGAISFYVADRLVARHAPPGEHGSVGIALGALLDGIPESVAIAISLIGGSAVSGAMVAAVLASNLPEGMASTPGFRRAGWPTKRILAMWVGDRAGRRGGGDDRPGRCSATRPDDVLGAINAFAAGTILTMIASVMLPTAFEDGREAVGLVFVLGFALPGRAHHARRLTAQRQRRAVTVTGTPPSGWLVTIPTGGGSVDQPGARSTRCASRDASSVRLVRASPKPRQLRDPAPNGTHAYSGSSWSRWRAGSNRIGSGHEAGSRPVSSGDHAMRLRFASPGRDRDRTTRPPGAGE